MQAALQPITAGSTRAFELAREAWGRRLGRLFSGRREMAERGSTYGATSTATEGGSGGKYLTFSLQNEEYGLEILKVREIIGLMDITSVPQTPEYVAGVINLRGKVIPVVDLRLKFGMPHEEFTDQTCIIVVEVQASKGQALVGIIVDTVSEVLDIRGADIEPAPEFGETIDTSFILGMGKVKEEVKILLDIDRVIRDSDLSDCGQAVEEA